MSLDLKKDMAQYLAASLSERRISLFEQVLSERTKYLSVVLEDFENTFDVSAVMRSVECHGVQDLHLVSQRLKLKVSRGVAVGASKWISTHKYFKFENNTLACLDRLQAEGKQIYVLGERGPSIESLPIDQPLSLWFGSHDLGVSDEALAKAQGTFTLPVHGFTPGFNISVQVALALATLRQRFEEERIAFHLSEEEYFDIKLEWLAKMPKRIKQMVRRFLEERQLVAEDLQSANFPKEALLRMCHL